MFCEILEGFSTPNWTAQPVKVYDLRQKCEGKGKFGTDKRHKRGGMRQKSVKMYVWDGIQSKTHLVSIEP